jgi:hypothetical protein
MSERVTDKDLRARVAKLEAALKAASEALERANRHGLLPEEAELALDLTRAALLEATSSP